MDSKIDSEITGEVLIPLENGNFFPDKHPPSFQDLSSCNYKSFRNVLFQGESLKFYIILKSFKQKVVNISDFFDNIFFKVEFVPNDIDKNLNIGDNENNKEDNNKNKESFFKFYSTNKNQEGKVDINCINNDTIEFEDINNKLYDENENAQIYEIIKEIIVPEDNINFNFLMKINLYYKNTDIFSENIKENNILNLYQLGFFNKINNYRHIKIFFKEVKIINALNILDMKQLEPKIDVSLIQTKINNYNNTYKLYDGSLKNSKIFPNMKSENKENTKKIDKNIYIENIRILEYETCFDEKATDEIEYIKEVLIKEKKLLNKKDYEIKLFNKNQFPYIIGSGEEFNLLFQITKNSYINESIYSTNKINKNNTKAKNESLNALTQGESITQTDVSKIVINSLSDFQSSVFLNTKESSLPFPKKKNSVMIPATSNKSITQKIQEPLLTLGNLIKKKMTFIPLDDNNSNNSNKNNTKNNSNNNANITNNTNKTKSDINNEKDSITVNDDDNNSLDSYFDEHFKIYYITPTLLELHSKLFYENINMHLQLKWFNEVNRFLMLSISIPEYIYINKYFEVIIKIKNISYNPMNLIIQIKENEKDVSINSKNKNKKIENVQSILSQTKIEHLGLIDCDDEKVHKLKFLPYVKGYCYLPNLTLFDIYSERKFYVVQNNRIFVEENNL